jgi:hypothetical protein
MVKHAVILPTEISLCGISPTKGITGGWLFTETEMRLRKGQQYSLFKDSVTCKKCLDVGKELVDVVCTCNNDD